MHEAWHQRESIAYNLGIMIASKTNRVHLLCLAQDQLVDDDQSIDDNERDCQEAKSINMNAVAVVRARLRKATYSA